MWGGGGGGGGGGGWGDFFESLIDLVLSEASVLSGCLLLPSHRSDLLPADFSPRHFPALLSVSEVASGENTVFDNQARVEVKCAFFFLFFFFPLCVVPAQDRRSPATLLRQT